VDGGFDALAGLVSVGGRLDIQQDTAEDVIDALTSLETVGEDLRIVETELEVLEGFPALVSIGRDLVIEQNEVLDSVDPGAFPMLETIGRRVDLRANPLLSCEDVADLSFHAVDDTLRDEQICN
jgi:hypothetical protein